MKGTITIPARRMGKAAVQRAAINSALRRGQVVALCTTRHDGRVSVQIIDQPR